MALSSAVWYGSLGPASRAATSFYPVVLSWGSAKSMSKLYTRGGSRPPFPPEAVPGPFRPKSVHGPMLWAPRLPASVLHSLLSTENSEQGGENVCPNLRAFLSRDHSSWRSRDCLVHRNTH